MAPNVGLQAASVRGGRNKSRGGISRLQENHARIFPTLVVIFLTMAPNVGHQAASVRGGNLKSPRNTNEEITDVRLTSTSYSSDMEIARKDVLVDITIPGA